MNKTLILFTLLLLATTVSLVAQDEARLLRFPAIYGNQIVFSYATDLYTVSASGGVARKLTNDEGVELFARFSPDGKWLAFTGQYDGNTEVYLIPSEGGIPKRLTYTPTLGRDDVSDRMGPNNLVIGWKHDNKSIVFRSRMREFNDFKGQLFLASVDGGLVENLPLPRGGFCSYSPDDKKLAYNRIFREFRTWKRYRGGMADDISIYDFETKKTENITNNPALDIIPMWSGNKIYFISDRDEAKRMNLYSYDLTSKETKQLTTFKEYDIKFPSLGDKAIVFENGGYIYKFDLATQKEEKVSIRIVEDMVGSRGGIIKVSDQVSNYEISPDGKRALFGARGDVFTVPAKNGVVRNITSTPGIHERNSKWSPDGKWIAYISDATGEDEIYMEQQDGSAPPTQITKNGDTYKYQIYWSPDSKKLLWADRRQRLQYVDIESKDITTVAQSQAFEFNQYAWSPDSKWITYTMPEVEMMNKVYLYSLENGKANEVTDGWYDASQPVFSSDGKYLFFVSDRDFNPLYSATEWNHAYQDMSRIYFVTLANDIDSPFKPKSDEVSIKEEKKEEKKDAKDKKDKKDEEKKDEKVVVKVDVDGLKDRIVSLPIQAANYGNLNSVGSTLYYTRRGSKDEQTQFMMYDLSEQKETNLGEIGGYEISADIKKMIVSKDRSYAIIDLPKSKIELKDKLDLSGMEVKLDRKAEWNQIYNECWRQMREFFYDPNMHGVDWKAIQKKYAPLVEHVSHRADLTYILGEVIGELNAGHTYVGGGDYPKAPRIPLGLLGAELERDASSKYYRIKKILKGQNWDKSKRSPLTEIGVNVKEGDFILAVDGKSTKEMNNIYEELVNKAGKQVKAKVNSDASEKGSRDVVVLPTDNEASLYYYTWVENNIKKVDEATNGKVGYIHIPDIGGNGLYEFIKHYYPQLKKKALIIDDRGNGGGNVSPQIIERLRREVAMISIARNTVPTTDPDAMVWGPKVCLIDEFSTSDGDIFPYRFKKYKLGKLIGKRTWGGVVGIRGSLPLLDGGFLNKPEFSRFGLDEKNWIMEGHGVDPDIIVDNDPAKEYAGVDEQLNKAIEVILEELKTQEKKLPPVPKYPDKR
ncbi:MAG: PD40 domain-containing protein [Ignavibacteriae bacterium]|nr:PD40 domain-containing protein [Ignavibacteriota bacterium]